MIDEKKKMTAQDSSVGADDGQSISKNSDISIAGRLLLGSCDRSVPRSCCWQTRQSTG